MVTYVCTHTYFRSFKNESSLQYFKYLLSLENWSFLATDEGSEIQFKNFFKNFTLEIRFSFSIGDAQNTKNLLKKILGLLSI